MSNNLEPIMGVVARVRRAMPRNAEVMLICDELEKAVTNRSQIAPSAASAKTGKTRAEIQRDYRIRKKAKK